MRNILILEDKVEHSEALKKIVEEACCDVRIFVAANILEASAIAADRTIHLFLLDIVLRPNKPGDVLGLKFATELRKSSQYEFTPIVFVTALEDPMLMAYKKLNCLAYIEKPFKKEKVREVVEKALRFPIKESKDKIVYFRKDGIIYAKEASKIIWIESQGRKIKIYCKDETLVIPYKTCEEMLRDLDSDWFVQCSRNSIVNRRYIKDIDYTNRFINMSGVSEPIEIGVVMKKRFRAIMENTC